MNVQFLLSIISTIISVSNEFNLGSTVKYYDKYKYISLMAEYKKAMRTISQMKDFVSQMQATHVEVLVELQDEKSKRLHNSFFCAMLKFKSTNDYLFEKFNLKKLIVPEVLKWPQNMYKFMQDSDYHMKGNEKKPLRVKETDIGYTKWRAFVMCKTIDDYNVQLRFCLLLRKQLMEYYTKYPNKCKNAPINIASLDAFYEYFASTMQRCYLLGCSFVHSIGDEIQSSTYRHLDFLEAFSIILPKWNFTQLEVDLLNIAWIHSEYNENEQLKVGHTLPKGIIIPAANHCLKSPTTPIHNYFTTLF